MDHLDLRTGICFLILHKKIQAKTKKKKYKATLLTIYSNPTAHDSNENLENLRACETVVKLKNYVDDSMIFLIVVFACLLNTILQSWIPIFQGRNIQFLKIKDLYQVL